VHHSRVDLAHIFISVPTSKEDYCTQRASAERAPSAKQGSPFYSFSVSTASELSMHQIELDLVFLLTACFGPHIISISLVSPATKRLGRFFSSSHQRPSPPRFQLFSAIDLGGGALQHPPWLRPPAHPLGANNVYAGINHFFYTCTLDGSTRTTQRKQHVHLVRGDALKDSMVGVLLERIQIFMLIWHI
jgi:hypothetical protein